MTGTTASPAGVGALSGYRRMATAGLLWAMMAYLGLGVLQIFFAGFGVFALNGKVGAPGETAFDAHRVVGLILAVVALIGVVLAVVARPGREPLILALVVLLIAAALQSVLANLGESGAFWGGLHALFGIGSLGVAGRVMADCRGLLRAD